MIAFSDPTQAPGRPAVPAGAGTHPAEAHTEAIGDEIARLSAHLNAATYQLLVLIRAFDEREGWDNGFLSCAHWLAWRTGISARPAREKVRVARALAPLDRISAAMANGTLSYSKVRALTRVATPENEADLLDVARHATAAQLEKLVRAWRRVEDLNDPEKEEQRHQRRFLRVYQDDDGSYRIQGRLDPEVGAVLEKALEWANEALYQENSDTAFQHRMADGLGLVAERALAADGAMAMDGGQPADRSPAGDTPTEKPRPVSRADRFQVVVHVGADELRSRAPLPSATGSGSAEPPDLNAVCSAAGQTARGSAEPRRSKLNRQGSEAAPAALGSAEPQQPEPRTAQEGRFKPTPTEGGSAEPPQSDPQGSGSSPNWAAGFGSPGTLESLPRETSHRLSCDAGLVVMTHGAKGSVLDVGRKTRTVPSPLRRALDARDKGCRFPGCECRYTEAHHIQHWAQGGETKLDNLLLLCSRHHRALHEGGFRVRRVADGARAQEGQSPDEGGLQMGENAGGDDFQFLSPSGDVIAAVPEPLPIPGDPVLEIATRNADGGVVPDAWTATPLWNGDSLDLSLAVDMFRGLRGG